MGTERKRGRTAVSLSIRGEYALKNHTKSAFQALWAVAFRGCIRFMIEWLLAKDIPLQHKIREFLLAPWKLFLFLSGQATEAAILDWNPEEDHDRPNQ